VPSSKFGGRKFLLVALFILHGSVYALHGARAEPLRLVKGSSSVSSEPRPDTNRFATCGVFTSPKVGEKLL
jgi:hypothetical protein